MLEASQIRFRYSDRVAWLLDRVSLSISPGEIVGLRGPSGCGKSTLARILGGYLAPHSGQVTVNGIALPKSGICPVQLVFQHPELAINPHFRIGKALAECAHDAWALAEPLGLERDWLDRFPHELSCGELQRVALARALGPETRYLLLDEITTMLDAVTQASIWRYLLRIVDERNIGVLAISHDTALLERVAGRLVADTHWKRESTKRRSSEKPAGQRVGP